MNANTLIPVSKDDFKETIAAMKEKQNHEGIMAFGITVKTDEDEILFVSGDKVHNGNVGSLTAYLTNGEGEISLEEFSHILDIFNPYMEETEEAMENDDKTVHPNIQNLLYANETIWADDFDQIEEKSAQGDESPVEGYMYNNLTISIVTIREGQKPENIDESYLVMYLFSEGKFSSLNENERFPLTEMFGALPTVEMSIDGIDDGIGANDKIPSYLGYKDAGTNRFVPLSFVRYGAFLGENNTLMFGAHVNIGAKIGNGNLLDGSCSIASCAQLGDNNKIGSFVSVEGVLSPVNAKPVEIGDDNFIGSNCRIGTGLKIGNKNLWGSGVDLSIGTPIRDMREDSDTFGEYVKAGDEQSGIQGKDQLMIILNKSVAVIADGKVHSHVHDITEFRNESDKYKTEITVFPGEYLLYNNTEEMEKRFKRNDSLTSNN